MKALVSNSVLTAAISLAVIFSTQASAEHAAKAATLEPAAVVQSISIPYAQAELSTDEGRASLYSKIRRAARSVCGPTGAREAGGLSLMSRNRKCYEEAVSAAVSQVGTGQLTAMLD